MAPFSSMALDRPLSVLVLLSLVLVQAASPNAEMLAATPRLQEIRSTIGSRARIQ